MSDLFRKLVSRVIVVAENADPDHLRMDQAKAIAEECIRQMKWAHSRSWAGTGPAIDACDVESLGIAPDGWTPEGKD